MRWLLLTSMVLILLLTCLPANLLASGAETGVIRLAFAPDIFSNADRNDAVSALKAWAAAVVKERRISDRVEISVLESSEELQQKFKADLVDGVTLTALELFKLDLAPESVYLTLVNDNPTLQYVLLVNKNGANSFDQLQTGKVILFDGLRMQLARLWFDGLLADERNFHSEEMRNFELLREENVSNAIFKVFFRQADAAIVTEEAFNLAVELNPQLGKDLQVLRKSEPLIPVIFIFRPSWQGPSQEVLDDALSNLHKTTGGQQVLTVFQSSRMERLPVAVISPTLEFVKQRQQLLGLNKGL